MKIDLKEIVLTRDVLAVYYQRLQPEIYSYVLKITRDRDAAEDLTADTFERVLEKRNIYKGPDFRNWAYTIARNLTLDHLRAKGVRTAFQNGVRHAVSEDYLIEEEKHQSSFKGGIEYALGLSGNNPEESAIAGEQLCKILGFIDAELSENSREALKLYASGYSSTDISQMLGITKNAAKLRIFQARRKVGKYAAEHLAI